MTTIPVRYITPAQALQTSAGRFSVNDLLQVLNGKVIRLGKMEPGTQPDLFNACSNPMQEFEKMVQTAMQ